MRRSTRARSWPLTVALALPICLATCALVVFALSELLGYTMWSYGPVQNLAEAAAIGSASEVVRRLEAGEDPGRLVSVRPHVISSAVARATALEAAVWSRSAELMELFDRAGAIVDAETRRHLTCLAGDIRVDEIVEYLAPDGTPQCVPEQALNLVVERSKAR